MTHPPNYGPPILLADAEGGLPLFVASNVVGSIGVSGMQTVQDAEIARAGIAVLGSG
jgi:glc operon protein GlcG